MLDVKSPWNNQIVGSVKKNNQQEIESIIEEVSKVSKLKGLDFPLIERLNVLKRFIEKIKNNIDELANLATSEGGKPITDSIIEIKRGAEGVESCIEILKSESGHVIPMNINETSKIMISIYSKRTNWSCFSISAFNHPFNLIIHQIFLLLQRAAQ